MRKKRIICIGMIKAAAFLLLFSILFHAATDLFRQKNMFYSISPIYDLPKGSVDVLFLGSSHVYASMSPMDLWNDYGITSFNASVGDLPLPTAYFELRELLKTQNPKVVVLESYYVAVNKMVNDEARFHYITDNIPFSLGMHEAIQTLVPEEYNKTQYYLNYYTFHNRWKTLRETDFKPWLLSFRFNRGSHNGFYNQHSAVEYTAIVPRSETEIPPELPLEYMYKIIEMCREKEVSLVFMVAPINVNTTSQKMINYVDTVAEKEGLSHVNFLYLLDETGFDFAKDMADEGHVNYLGAQKLTSYMGEYLQTNYHLEDHRGDSAIANLWNEDYETFAREINNVMIKISENADGFLGYLQRNDYIVAWNAYSETPLSETALPDLLKSMGIDPTGVKEENWYYAVTRGDRLHYGRAINERPNDSYMMENMLFSFGAGMTGSTNRVGVHAGKKEYSAGNTGANLVVYDPVTRMVVDSVNIDLVTLEITRK